MPERAEIEAPEFDEQAITDILVAIDDTLWGCGRERMDLIDGPAVDALRDVVKRELVAFAARSSRDGTVAVEDVAEILREARETLGGVHVVVKGPNAGWVGGVDGYYDDDAVPAPDCRVCAVQKRIDEVLAEFGSARAGESNEGGNQNDERRR